MKRILLPEQRIFLEKLFPGTSLFSQEEMYVYATDASLIPGSPLAVVHPDRVEQVQELFRWACREKMPIYPRARGTSTVGSCVPDPPGVVVSSARMDAIVEISDSDFVGVTQPGVVTARFQSECEKRGLFYPPDPASVKASTLGGNVATCAGGMRSLKYGVTRDFVLGLEAVLPTGEHISLGGRNHKNVVGLDLVRLLTGSEGTLAFLTSLTLKLLPLPAATASLLVGFKDAATALNTVGKVFNAGILPTALEFVGPALMRCIREITEVPWPETMRFFLLFQLDGNADTLSNEMNRLMALLEGAVWMQHCSGPEEDSLWHYRRLIGPASFVLGPVKLQEDIVVPRGSMLAAFNSIEEIGRQFDKTMLICGHIGDGNIHTALMYDPANIDDAERSHAAFREVSKLAVAMGGSISGEHGIGMVKDITLQAGPVEVSLMRRIKAIFDPENIMNPGKGY